MHTDPYQFFLLMSPHFYIRDWPLCPSAPAARCSVTRESFQGYSVEVKVTEPKQEDNIF